MGLKSLMQLWKMALQRLQNISVKQRITLLTSFVLFFSLHSFPKSPKELFPRKDSLCLLIGSSVYPWFLSSWLWASRGCLLSLDLRKNNKVIRCIHLGMILQNLTLVLISVQLRALFSWVSWCFIYVGHTSCYDSLVRAVCALAGAFCSATFVSHICYTMKGWSSEVQGNASLWWMWSSAMILHLLEETIF